MIDVINPELFLLQVMTDIVSCIFCFLWFMRHESWFMIYYARPFLFMSLLQWCFWCWDGSILFVLSHSWFLITVFGFCLFLEIQLALKLVGVFNLSFCPSIGPSFVGYAVVVVIVVVVVVVVVALLLFLRFPVLVLVAPFLVITVLVGHCHTLLHGCVVTSSLPACKCCIMHNAE